MAIEKNSVGIVKTKTMRVVDKNSPLKLDCGKTLAPIDVAYETYGKLNESGDNAIYICHALTGNAHVAGYNNPDDKKPGWWEDFVGPGKYIDTDKYFVVCSNFLGGCSGTTGPSSINPETNEPYCLDFPMFTIPDIVRVQKLLIDRLGIKQLLAVVGGSMGGMQTLQWAIEYPDFIKAAVPLATTPKLSAQSIAFDAVGRNAITADPNFNNGKYYESKGPANGLSIARMVGHITYLSEKGMREKFGRQLRTTEDYNYDFNSEFSVETYLDYQGQRFVERFDANCYLYITKAMDYFDLVKSYGSLRKAFQETTCRFLIASFSSDWLFTPEQSQDMVEALLAEGKDVSYCNISSPYGHDAFLLEPETLGPLVQGFIDSTYEQPQHCPVQLLQESEIPELVSTEQVKRLRVDYQLIDSIIKQGSRVLDVGCGNGNLLQKLKNDKNIKAEGIEIDQARTIECVQKGISVIHRDIEQELSHYEDDCFDYAILSQTMQTLRNPKTVFNELLRVSNKVVVSFPNFAYWRCRLQLLINGQAPISRNLPFSWYDSPNIHFLSLKDFEQMCNELNVNIEQKIPLKKSKPRAIKFAPNFFAAQAVYVISKK